MDLYPMDKIGINNPVVFLILVIVYGLCIRLFLSMLRAFDVDSSPLSSIRSNTIEYFCGFYLSTETDHSDHWLTFILGIIELSIYPILIVTHNWSFIGAWLGFKTVAQWGTWGKNRNTFNRFLIGNVIVLLVSYLLLTGFIFINNCNCCAC